MVEATTTSLGRAYPSVVNGFAVEEATGASCDFRSERSFTTPHGKSNNTVATCYYSPSSTAAIHGKATVTSLWMIW